MRPGARRILVLFLLTIATAVSFHNFLGMPPVLGMLTGLGYLQLFGFFLKRSELKQQSVASSEIDRAGKLGDIVPVFSYTCGSMPRTLHNSMNHESGGCARHEIFNTGTRHET